MALAASALGACQGGDAPSEQETAHVSEAIVEGTPEAAGLLAFLNHGETTFAVLDDDVPLPSHAAAAVIAHRDGPDAVFGTADDDLFDDVAEVAAVPHIGPQRLADLVAFAAAQGFVPQGDDLLGTYDDVSFTVNEATATLALVNGATHHELDVTIGLDKRAADSIVAAQPIGTVLALSELYFVGTSALSKLKGWAAASTLPGEGADCTAQTGCAANLSCVGIPFDGSPAIGKCADTSPLPGQGDDCGHHFGGCNEGLECVGLTVYGGDGFCRPLWMVGIFESNEILPIPDAHPGGIAAEVVVYGLATVPEDIVVTLDIDHPRPQDLHVELVSANGSSAVLWNHEANPDSYTYETWGIERDNFVNGTWRLEVSDTVSGETGVLKGYELHISSRYD